MAVTVRPTARRCVVWSLGLGLLVAAGALAQLPAGYQFSRSPGYTVHVLGPAHPSVSYASGPAPAGTVVVFATAPFTAVVGAQWDGSRFVAAHWPSSATGIPAPVEPLGTLHPGAQSFLLALNPRGRDLVGWNDDGTPEARPEALRWSVVDLLLEPIATGMQVARALAITDDPRVAGVCLPPGVPLTLDQLRPCVGGFGAWTLLPTLGGTVGQVRAYAGDGTLVGQAETTTGQLHAVRWDSESSAAEDLNPSGADASLATALTERTSMPGELIVGHTTQPTQLPWLWQAGVGHTMLPLLAGMTAGTMEGISATRVMIGTQAPSPLDTAPVPGQEAVRYTDQGGLERLSSLITTQDWTIYQSVGINQLGYILAYGTHDGQDYAVLLAPLPGDAGVRTSRPRRR